MKSILLSFILFFCISLFSAEMIGKVVSVTDGDTITIIENLDNGRFKIRLYGIDAPEKKQDFGQKAKQHLSSLIFNKVVKIKFTEIDRYGRIVGKIFLNDIEINIEMLKAGLAWHYSRYDQTSTYINAEKQERTEKRGIWSIKNSIPPWEYRKHK